MRSLDSNQADYTNSRGIEGNDGKVVIRGALSLPSGLKTDAGVDARQPGPTGCDPPDPPAGANGPSPMRAAS